MEKSFKEILVNWVLNNEVNEEKQEEIRNIIIAFSEFIYSTNLDYLYNKTYLAAFIEDFLLCKEKLKKKYNILMDIIYLLLVEKVDLRDFKVYIADSWFFENGEIKLFDNFICKNACSNKLKYCIEYKKGGSFTISNEIDITKKYEDEIKKDIDFFIKNIRR